VLDERLQRQIDEDESFLHRDLKQTTQSDIRGCSEFVLSWIDMWDVDESALLAGLVAEFSVVVELDAGLCNRIDERAQAAQSDTVTRHEIGFSDRSDRASLADRNERSDNIHVLSEEVHFLLTVFVPEPRPQAGEAPKGHLVVDGAQVAAIV